ncbi:hypothetical protein [Streptomyces sp. NRRL S-241]|uniref:hypothetical protein n=1 Tax=Streptomyces sp. NRRL S-241 TaxID=1463896 RepID=UPI00131E4F09|nr:hypothetical protein [Streptomyces sp. NRRL S-241]
MADLTPLNAPYPMSWAPTCCDWCQAEEIAWAYPVGEVSFPRTINAAGDVATVKHHAQPWFACARCDSYLKKDEWDELAILLGWLPDYWHPVRDARLNSSGYAYCLPRHRRHS